MARIETQAQYDSIMKRIEELLAVVDDNTPENDAGFVELSLLSHLAADYEDEHFPIEKPSLAAVLKLRMAEMNINQGALAALLGMSRSKVSEICSGKCEPTLKQAREISLKLNIAPAVVLGV